MWGDRAAAVRNGAEFTVNIAIEKGAYPVLRKLLKAAFVLLSLTYLGCPTTSRSTVIPFQPGNPTFYNLGDIINCLVDSPSDHFCWVEDSPAT